MIDVDRPSEAPASLATTASYKGEDVRRSLLETFFGKCYLCEGPFVHEQFNVEHLRPKHAFPELEREWTNLFPAHGQSCNNRRINWDGRKQGWPVDGMLDCAGGENVEKRLYQALTYSDELKPQVEFRAIDPNDKPADNTARELMYIHNGSPQASHRCADRMLREIEGQYGQALACLIRYLTTRQPNDLRRLEVCFLAKNAHYSAVVRTSLRNHLRKLKPQNAEQLYAALEGVSTSS